MTTATEPLLALSWDDYQAKQDLLGDLPHKKAVLYVEDLKYQVLAATVLGSFERYPSLSEIRFTDDGTRDSNVSGYDLIASGPGEGDGTLPMADHGVGDEYNLPALDEMLWWFFDDEDFRADLSQSVFRRDVAVEQLKSLLMDTYHQVWDVPWDDFVARVYEHWGFPDALTRRAQAQAAISDNPAIREVFACVRGTRGFEAAIKAAPEDTYTARMTLPGVVGEPEEWSPLSLALFHSFNNDEVARSLRNTLLFTTHKLAEGQVNDFVKLAGPKNDPATWAPTWLDPLSLLWLVSGRCSFADNGHRRESWSENMFQWGGVTAAQADTAALEFCAMMGPYMHQSPWANHHAYRKSRVMMEKIWSNWLDGRAPESDRFNVEGAMAMSHAMLRCGGPVRGMGTWQRGGLPKSFGQLPPWLALRLGLAALVKETSAEEIGVAEAWLLGRLEDGAALGKDDAYLDELLAGQGVTEVVRARILACLIPEKASASDEEDAEA